MGHFSKGICPIIRVYINLLLKKRINDQPRDQRSVSHSLTSPFFSGGQAGENFTLRVRRCYTTSVRAKWRQYLHNLGKEFKARLRVLVLG